MSAVVEFFRSRAEIVGNLRDAIRSLGRLADEWDHRHFGNADVACLDRTCRGIDHCLR